MSDTMVDRLSELMSRAGASDTDRQAWLAERHGGVTATEVRDLYIRARRAEDLIDIKLGWKPDPFVQTKYTVWGSLREPVLAAIAEATSGIRAESRVFHAADNARKLASPDGIGQDFDGQLLVGEYKTSKHAIPLGSEAIAKKGYVAQMVWQMHVTGANRCLYLWEQHNDDWRDVGEQFPQPSGILQRGREWVEYDAKLAAELERIALNFLAQLDAAATSEYVAPDFDDDLDTLAVNYIRFRDMESEGKRAKEDAGKQIKARLKDLPRFSQESALARITWTRGGSSTGMETTEHRVVDLQAARAAHATEYLALEKADAALDKAEAAAQRARDRREKALAQWTAVLPAFTSTDLVETPVVRHVRENLTITAPKIQEPKA